MFEKQEIEFKIYPVATLTPIKSPDLNRREGRIKKQEQIFSKTLPYPLKGCMHISFDFDSHEVCKITKPPGMQDVFSQGINVPGSLRLIDLNTPAGCRSVQEQIIVLSKAAAVCRSKS